MAMTGAVAIVMPVLDDWMSFFQLLREIDHQQGLAGRRIRIMAVNDGSRMDFNPDCGQLSMAGSIEAVEIINLAVNLGHQRAIAVGLAAIAEQDDVDTVVVMDCDGEDRPEDVAVLLAAGARDPRKAILARRTRRTETVGFKIGYKLYKFCFKLLTGRTINFGNFSVLPIAAVRRLVRMPDLWNNLPAAIIRSRIDTISVPLARGHRIAGRSHMNLAGLVIHGLSAMSVFSEVIFIRILLMSGLISAITVILMLGVVAIRFLTQAAIPGWATTAFGVLTIVLVQVLVTTIATTFVVLSARSHRPIVPATDSASFIVTRDTFHPARP